jgi:two-component system phosphate regulon response regulator PhoB
MPPLAGRGNRWTTEVKQTIYLVEDNRDICLLLKFNLEQAGYNVEYFADAGTALLRSRELAPSLFLLDIMLPGRNGLDLCRELKAKPEMAEVPIIFITAKTSEQDRIRGLELGADDYISKPFSPREVVLRVNAALRRVRGVPRPSFFSFGDVEIDPSAMTLRVRGVECKTTTLEFRILETLARSPGRVFSRDRLLTLASGADREVGPRAVDVYVSRIREKIEPDPSHPVYLKTVRGAGYRFVLGEQAEK